MLNILKLSSHNFNLWVLEDVVYFYMYSSQPIPHLPGSWISLLYKEEGPAAGSTIHVISLIFVWLWFDVFYSVSQPSTMSSLLSFLPFLWVTFLLTLPLLFCLMSFIWFVILPFLQKLTNQGLLPNIYNNKKRVQQQNVFGEFGAMSIICTQRVLGTAR